MMTAALVHPVERFSWTTFDIHWSTVIGIAALAALYVWRARVGDTTRDDGTLRALADAHPETPREPPSVTRGQQLAFGAGLLVLFFTLNGPLHDLSDSYLFSAHMVQHLLLTMLVTPLLIAGTPGWMLRPTLRARAVNAIAHRITTGPAAFAIFNVTFAAWHLPPLYNLAMTHHPVHIVEHLCFLVTSTIMWWPLMSSMPELPRLTYPKQMLYLFLMTFPMTAVAIIITYSDSLLYPFYAGAPRIFPLTPLEDQRAGGLIMWIPAGFIFITILSVIFFKWVGALERADQAEGAAPTRTEPGAVIPPRPARAQIPGATVGGSATYSRPS